MSETTTLLHAWTVEEFVFAEETMLGNLFLGRNHGPFWPEEHR